MSKEGDCWEADQRRHRIEQAQRRACGYTSGKPNCKQCGGSGQLATPPPADSLGRKSLTEIFSSNKCSRCNGTGNEP